MKRLLNFTLFESSVGAYNFTKDDEFHYYFNDEFGNEFMVEFDRIGNEVEVVYLVKDNTKKYFKWSYKEVSTNIFKVTETILGRILPDFLASNDWVEEVLIKGLSKEKESDIISKRTKWYLRYLKNNPIEGWNLDYYQNDIFLYRN